MKLREVKMGLISQKSTTVKEEEDFKFNAPHTFVVENVTDGSELLKVHFQEGPVKENGINGIFNEDLIAMVIRRLESFQVSEYACRENALAITKLEESLMWLRKRTMDREARNVDGTSKI